MMRMTLKSISSPTKPHGEKMASERSLSRSKAIVLLCILLFLFGCAPNSSQLEPRIFYTPPPRFLQALPSPFEKLTKEELRQEWGREFYVGLHFANEMDLYRAITAFKTALIFIPSNKAERRLQIDYCIFECYYLGEKYVEAIETFNNSPLSSVSSTFPAYRELVIMLYDSYRHTCQEENAEWIFDVIHEHYPETANQLLLSYALKEGDIEGVKELESTIPNGDGFVDYLARFECLSKSVTKARNLNAVLPGAGYYYVGQKKAAVTSFIINALFIGATYCFIKNGNIPAALVTASLESGWYIGGINGAGLAAKEYNEHLYEVNTKEVLLENRLFPVLMLEKSF